MPLFQNFPPASSVCSLVLLSLALLTGCSKEAAPTSSPSGTKPLTKVTLQSDWLPTAEHGGYYQALTKGYYRDAGLEVEVRPGGPGNYVTQMVVTGEVAFAMGRSDDVMLAVQQGLPLMIVCAQMQHDPIALMVHEQDSFRAFSDLAGRHLAASPGAAWTEFLQKKYSVRFSISPLDYGMARFAADPTLIQQCYVSSEPFFLEQKGVRTRTLLLADSGYDPYRVIFSTAAFVREHPEVVRAFVAASIRGWDDFMQGDATAARSMIATRNPQNPPALMDFSTAAMRRYHLISGNPEHSERTGLLQPSRFEELEKQLLDLGILKTHLELDRFVRFDFVPPAPSPSH